MIMRESSGSIGDGATLRAFSEGKDGELCCDRYERLKTTASSVGPHQY